MRILIAIGIPGKEEMGAAGVVLNAAREFRKGGHKVDCWFLEDILERPAKHRRFGALIFAARLARRILRERSNYDVVNLHAPWGCIYGVWRKIFRPTGAPPYVMTMHGSEERFVRAMRREHKRGSAWHFGWRNRLWHRFYHQTMFDWSIRSADYGAVVNREAWIMAELKYNRAPGRFHFVPNGTEEQFFIERSYEERALPRLLYVGSWLDRKGVYYLVDAFGPLARRIPGLELTVAGCMVPEDRVKEFFALEVRDRVRVMPFVKREDMPGVYASHDILVFPSLVEGMPLTLLEAMAAGMPVVTTETCGMADVVEDGINGLLVPPAEAEMLADAIERCCRSAELRRQLGQEAQNAMRRYTWERIAGRLESILLMAAKQGTKG